MLLLTIYLDKQAKEKCGGCESPYLLLNLIFLVFFSNFLSDARGADDCHYDRDVVHCIEGRNDAEGMC